MTRASVKMDEHILDLDEYCAEGGEFAEHAENIKDISVDDVSSQDEWEASFDNQENTARTVTDVSRTIKMTEEGNINVCVTQDCEELNISVESISSVDEALNVSFESVSSYLDQSFESISSDENICHDVTVTKSTVNTDDSLGTPMLLMDGRLGKVQREDVISVVIQEGSTREVLQKAREVAKSDSFGLKRRILASLGNEDIVMEKSKISYYSREATTSKKQKRSLEK